MKPNNQWILYCPVCGTAHTSTKEGDWNVCIACGRKYKLYGGDKQ